MKTRNLTGLSILVLFLCFGVSLKAQVANPADKIEKLKGLIPLDAFKMTPEQSKSFDLETNEDIYFEDGKKLTFSDLSGYLAGIDYIMVPYAKLSDKNTVLAMLVRKCTPEERQAQKLIKEKMGWEEFPGGVDPNTVLDLDKPETYEPIFFDPNLRKEDFVKNLIEKPTKTMGITQYNLARVALFDEKGKLIPLYLADKKTQNPVATKYLSDPNFTSVFYKEASGLIKALAFRRSTLQEKKMRGQTISLSAPVAGGAGDSMSGSATIKQKVSTPEGLEGAFVIGKKADDFTSKDMKGNDISLSQYQGKKVVVLNFWFTKCKPCVAEMPQLNKLVEEYKGKDVEFISFCNDDEKTINEFLKANKFDYRIVPNTLKLANKYKIAAFPTHVVIDKNSKTIHYELGGSDKVGESLKKAIDSVL